MQPSPTCEELADVLVIYFRQLVQKTNTCVDQFFDDEDSYKHYLSPYPMIYMFYFVDEICRKYLLEGYENRYALLMKIFTESFSLSEEEAKEGATAASSLGMDASKRITEEGWMLGEVIYRLAKQDVDEFKFDAMTKQQIDHYNLLVLLDHQKMF